MLQGWFRELKSAVPTCLIGSLGQERRSKKWWCRLGTGCNQNIWGGANSGIIYTPLYGVGSRHCCFMTCELPRGGTTSLEYKSPAFQLALSSLPPAPLHSCCTSSHNPPLLVCCVSTHPFCSPAPNCPLTQRRERQRLINVNMREGNFHSLKTGRSKGTG